MFRANHLRDFITGKKAEYTKINSDLAGLLIKLFELFFDEYKRQKNYLRWDEDMNFPAS